MSGITRRSALLGAGSAALAAGFAGIALRNEDDLIHATLHRLLGPFRIDKTDMAAFSRDFANIGPLPRGLAADAVGAVQMSGVLPVVIGAVGAKIEDFQRSVLTAFVTGTDYLDLENPAQDKIHYIGPSATRACASPFARFD